ncbi:MULTISPECIES: ExbD/TolR family protein [Pseudoalteromonas]|uniref:Biopolymer transporter ExbD n=1 Tax=Pseudoalteromonas ruthenica TaxID=151081 RepID=A0A0F4PYY2_9GAMM|nr:MULTISPECIES: biopolymer transporter ExbD [Pseudoalteromonas]KJY95843.1 hypothetical protein TW76_14920 [Pseudoalteromonas ruthenica]KJZ00269.1 hypothetical protein TW72_06025 [Pseudoalteromonas ruthenica]MCF2860892.1 biopolymer transporter ExbD [Pseudoalteromonas sp. CNAT2-18]MCG7545630.1 biopolymer transporter ExbD [Pseudoalteromonas sp. MM17-2]MCG7556761.1 biopolymer transporter ExbD [Pseudoalteromonas sp. CNAT2-18.1]|tara:strand:+ start:41362 stop:41751 length:390 start_codon:yes stop_codon:yes gene_type:complete
MNRKRPTNTEAQADMTPMLDVVFILLIFFVVTTSFVREHSLSVTRPESNSAVSAENKTLMIQVTHSNHVVMAGRNIETSQIASNIARISATEPFSSVAIRAHEQSRHQQVVTVMNAVREMGQWPIALVD